MAAAPVIPKLCKAGDRDAKIAVVAAGRSGLSGNSAPVKRIQK